MTGFTGEKHLAFWKKRLTPTATFIYVIQGDPGQPIKVGTAQDPFKRMLELQTGNPQQLRLLFVVPGNHQLEWNLHKRIWRSRVRGEWFDGPEIPDFLDFVRDLAQRMVDGHNGTRVPPDWRDFGKWKRTFRTPQPSPPEKVSGISTIEMPPPVDPEEAKRRLAAHYMRPARSGSPFSKPGETGTIS